MITQSVTELNNAKAKVAELEQKLVKELASLPFAYGFNSLNSFVAAVEAAAGKGRIGRPRKVKAKAVKRRKRATITDAVRIKVKHLVKAGKTGSHIAKALGISMPSVQNIKKALGLVRGHKKSAPKAMGSKSKKAPPKKAPAPKAKKRKAAKKVAAVAQVPVPEAPQVPAA